MYRMKNIITYDDEITLPKCMYNIKTLIQITSEDDINISSQVPNKEMTDLEHRQDLLMKKLDMLYDKIKTISSVCNQSTLHDNYKNRVTKNVLSTPDEIVIAVNPDNLPYFINLFLKDLSVTVRIFWHIHSSIPNEKVPKINAFIKKLRGPGTEKEAKVNLRLIFRSGSADSELKLSSLNSPILGTVNILRYLSYIYPNVLPYDQEDFYMDGLLDLCHQLERTPEKKREVTINQILTQCKDWIYKNQFSIADVAFYNVIKQWQNSTKYVTKNWLHNCENKCM